MSMAAMKWVLDDAPVTSAQMFATLVVYANFANENGRSYPSTETVVTKSRQNIKTARAAIDALESAGLLIDTGKRVGRTGSVKVYALGMEGLPEVGALPGEVARAAEEEPQEAAGAPRAQARPETGGLRAAARAPVSGSKLTQKREAEPVLEPIPPEDADASSPPERRKKPTSVIEDWVVPTIASLPAEIRVVAEQWPEGAYATHAAGHRAHKLGQPGRRRALTRSELDQSWFARVVQLGVSPMRAAKSGLSLSSAPAAATAVSPAARADQLERSAALMDRMGRADDALLYRRQAAEVRRPA